MQESQWLEIYRYRHHSSEAGLCNTHVQRQSFVFLAISPQTVHVRLSEANTLTSAFYLFPFWTLSFRFNCSVCSLGKGKGLNLNFSLKHLSMITFFFFLIRKRQRPMVPNFFTGSLRRAHTLILSGKDHLIYSLKTIIGTFVCYISEGVSGVPITGLGRSVSVH